jgi:hypothetical protein
MMNDARKVFRDWINSPRYQSKLTFQLCSIGDTSSSINYDEYTIVGLNSRFKWFVSRETADIWIDFSGIITPNNKFWDTNFGIEVFHKITSDSYYVLDYVRDDYTPIKYASFAELLINECFQYGITLIEKYIEEYAYIFVLAADDGGSMGGVRPKVEFQHFLNTRLSKQFSKVPIKVTYPHTYFTSLVRPKENLYRYC